jgi:hypothetical protein
MKKLFSKSAPVHPKTPLPARPLIDEATGKPVRVGQRVTDFRGERWTVTGWTEPAHAGSTGRVHVKQGQTEMSYYPSVFNLSFMTQETHR